MEIVVPEPLPHIPTSDPESAILQSCRVMNLADIFSMVERFVLSGGAITVLISFLIKLLGQEWVHISGDLKKIRFAQQRALGKADDPKAVVARRILCRVPSSPLQAVPHAASSRP